MAADLRTWLQPWDSQPASGHQVDWGNPDTLGLTGAWIGNAGRRNLAGWTNLFVPTEFGVSAGGVIGRFAGLIDDDNTTIGSSLSFIAAFVAGTTDGQSAVLSRGTAGNEFGFHATHADGGYSGAVYCGSSYTIVGKPTGGALTSGTRYVVGASIAGGSGSVYSGGSKTASATGLATIGTASGGLRWGQTTAGGDDWTSPPLLEVLYVWNRRISDDAHRRIAESLYSLLEPRRIIVPVSAGGGGTNLTLADASHAHAADNVVLTTATTLAVADCTHSHAVDGVVLTVDSLLAVAEATHAHTADNVTLSIAGATNLSVADATHAHTVDALALTSAHSLIVADATHGHTVDGLTLTAASVLAIQEALHAHEADNVTLLAGDSLLIADALHAHTSDGVALTVDAWLTVADALHGHAADNVVLTLPTSADVAAIVAAIMAEEIETGVSVRMALRIILAAVSGPTAGIGTSTERYYSSDGLVARITANFDGDSNRTSVTLDDS